MKQVDDEVKMSDAITTTCSYNNKITINTSCSPCTCRGDGYDTYQVNVMQRCHFAELCRNRTRQIGSANNGEPFQLGHFSQRFGKRSRQIHGINVQIVYGVEKEKARNTGKK